MASSEHQLISLIMKTGDLKTVLEWGITEDDLLMNDTNSAFKILMSVYTSPDSRGAVLGPSSALERYLPAWQFEVDAGMTLNFLCSEVRKRRLSKELKLKAQACIEYADLNPEEAFNQLNEAVTLYRNIDAGKSTDVDLATGMKKVIAKYNKAKNGQSIGRFMWPWKPLQEATGGVADDEFAVFYGRPKSMKSWILMYLITFAFEMNQKVLFYTKEMTDEQCYQRMAAIMVGALYQDLRLGKLPAFQEEQLHVIQQVAEEMASKNRMICLTAKDVAGRDTPSWLRGKIEKYHPDVVFVDGLYLMSPEARRKTMQDHERVREISRDVRRIVLEEKVPLMATMQANRQAAKHSEGNLDEIAFSDSLSQDCTMACRVMSDKHQPTISLVMAGSREWTLDGFRVHGIPASNFSFHSVLTSKEIEQVRKNDEEEDEPKDKKPVRQPRTLGAEKPAPNYKKTLENMPLWTGTRRYLLSHRSTFTRSRRAGQTTSWRSAPSTTT